MPAVRETGNRSRDGDASCAVRQSQIAQGPPQQDGGDLRKGRGARRDDDHGQHGNRGAPRVRGQRLRHPPDGLRDDRDCDQLQAVQQRKAHGAAECRRAIRKEHKGHGGRQGEADPRRDTRSSHPSSHSSRPLVAKEGKFINPFTMFVAGLPFPNHSFWLPMSPQEQKI